MKGLRLFLRIYGGSTNFHILQQNIPFHPRSLVKLALRLQMSLNNNLAAHSAESILQKSHDRNAIYATEIIKLIRFNGTKTINKRRLTLYLSEWYRSTEYIETKTSKIIDDIPILVYKKPKPKASQNPRWSPGT